MAGLGKRGRPKGSIQQINYVALKALASRQATIKQISDKLGISDETLRKRLRTDPGAKRAYEEGIADGQIFALNTLWATIEEHWLTFCTNPECLHIEDSKSHYVPRCPKCESRGVDADGNDKVYQPKFERMRADNRSLDLVCKNFLNLTDKVEHSGNEDKPMVFSTLAEFAKHQAQKAHATKKQKEQIEAPED